MENNTERIRIGEAAKSLGVTVPTIRRWEAQGKITAYRTPAGERRFERSEIDRLRNVTATPEAA